MVMMMVSMSKMHGGLSGMIGLNDRLPLRLIGAMITGMMDGTMLKQLMRCFQTASLVIPRSSSWLRLTT